MANPNNKEPHFYHYLAEGNIICELKAETKIEAIEELSKRLTKNTAGLDYDEVKDAVIAREQVVPTVLAPGLAVPHARMADVKQLVIGLGTSMEGIDFDAPGMPPVNVIIQILTPKDDPGLHLQVLAALAKDFKDPETVRKLAAMETPSELIDFFHMAEGELPNYLRAKDVMNSSPVVLKEIDSLNKAIETFALKKVYDIPVVDDEGDIRGVISLEDILKFSLPEHLLWMNDLSPILRFEPFTEMLRNDHETKLADFMREDFIAVEEEIPAIQLAKIFLMNNVRQIIVSKGQKLCGVVNIAGFSTKLFWA